MSGVGRRRTCLLQCTRARAPLIAWILSLADPPIYLPVQPSPQHIRTHTQGFKLSATGQCLACPANCGECQVIGGTTTSCTQCNANFGQCSTGLCTDLTSKSNCGACGVTCNGGQVCCNQGGTYKCLGSGACT